MSDLLTAIGYGTVLFWVLLSVALCTFAILVVLVVKHFRVHKMLRGRILKSQVDALDTDTHQEELRQMLAETGYAYDREQNIFYSVTDPWQKKMGYCRLYDDWATPIGLVFDCEPIRFNYNGKRWLIEFWKGQYGITSGGEIGIYNTADPDVDIPGIFKGTFYHSVGDEESLTAKFTLYKNNKPMFTRADRHWWLTGFVLGEYSDPSSLTMETSVTFTDRGMREAFLDAFRNLGYQEGDFIVIDDTVSFTFAYPRSIQPVMRRSPVKFLAMLRLRAFVAEYRRQTEGLTDMYDILTMLKTKSPLLYQLAVNIGRRKESFRYHDVIGRYTGQHL